MTYLLNILLYRDQIIIVNKRLRMLTCRQRNVTKQLYIYIYIYNRSTIKIIDKTMNKYPMSALPNKKLQYLYGGYQVCHPNYTKSVSMLS